MLTQLSRNNSIENACHAGYNSNDCPTDIIECYYNLQSAWMLAYRVPLTAANSSLGAYYNGNTHRHQENETEFICTHRSTTANFSSVYIVFICVYWKIRCFVFLYSWLLSNHTLMFPFCSLQARAVSPCKRRKTSGKQVGNKMFCYSC